MQPGNSVKTIYMLKVPNTSTEHTALMKAHLFGSFPDQTLAGASALMIPNDA